MTSRRHMVKLPNAKMIATTIAMSHVTPSRLRNNSMPHSSTAAPKTEIGNTTLA